MTSAMLVTWLAAMAMGQVDPRVPRPVEPSPPPVVVVEPPPPAPPLEPVPSTVQPAAPSGAETPAVSQSTIADEPRPSSLGFRAGGTLGLGLFLPAPAMLSAQLFDVHLGVQVNPDFGAYFRLGYSASVGLGLQVNSMGATVSPAAAGFWLLGANAELSLGNMLFLAGGPQVGIGGWTRARLTGNASGGEVQVVTSTGLQPGLDFKLGLGFGRANASGRRPQFVLALDLSFLYASNVVDVSAMGSAQGAGIAVSFSEALSVVPTLQFGFEWR